MTPEQANRLVVASLIIITATAVLGNVGEGKTPKPRLFIAGGVVFLLLAIMADFAPQIAGPLAVLVTIAVLLNQGEGAFGALAKRLQA